MSPFSVLKEAEGSHLGHLLVEAEEAVPGSEAEHREEQNAGRPRLTSPTARTLGWGPIRRLPPFTLGLLPPCCLLPAPTCSRLASGLSLVQDTGLLVTYITHKYLQSGGSSAQQEMSVVNEGPLISCFLPGWLGPYPLSLTVSGARQGQAALQWPVLFFLMSLFIVFSACSSLVSWKPLTSHRPILNYSAQPGISL